MRKTDRNACTYSVETPPAASGAIAIVRLVCDDLDELLGALRLPTIGVGQVRLAQLLDVDQGLIARCDQRTCDLMIHGGRAVIEALRAALGRHGVVEMSRPDLRSAWPEADDELEARMLEALAQAPSPRAIDLLLAQPARWRAAPDARMDDETASALRHLLAPPLVMIAGPPNIGKSSLLNALAGREAAAVADVPGTTRDAVAAVINVDGLTVRLLDAPGYDPAEADPIVMEATRIARHLAAAAELIVVCGDARTVPSQEGDVGPNNAKLIRVATRVDLGAACWPHDVAASARTKAGLSDLAVLIRRNLVSDEALADPRPWRFW